MSQNRKNQCLKTSSDIPGDLRLPSAFLRSNFRRSSDFCGDLKQPRAIFCNLRTSYYQIGLLTTQVARSPRHFLTPQQFLAKLRSPRNCFDISGVGTTSTWWGNQSAHAGGTARPGFLNAYLIKKVRTPSGKPGWGKIVKNLHKLQLENDPKKTQKNEAPAASKGPVPSRAPSPQTPLLLSPGS